MICWDSQLALGLLHFLFSFVLVVLFCSFISAGKFGVQPDEIFLNGKIGEMVCSKINFVGEFNGSGEVRIKWANKGYDGRDYKKHVFSSEEVGIRFLSFSFFDSNIPYEFCVVPEIEGSFHGALVFYPNDENVAVGNWVSVNLEKKGFLNNEKGVGGEFFEDRDILLKNRSFVREESFGFYFLFIFFSMNSLLLFFLLLLIVIAKKRGFN